ncbi:DUF6151 family protein [Kordiimonas sp.]|uniref:DUF6151 family protein n=1 Tax=Kordiimonas sp. TaxID=1970157 RepID=UPI003A8ED135
MADQLILIEGEQKMATDVPMSCTCGKVKGMIRGLSPASTNHVRCPCVGCQSYAHYLGRADDMLDEGGYSNIFQMNPRNFEIHEGHEHLAAVRITKTGPLRWYTDCCKTPLGNTFPRGGMPFLGVLPICTGFKGTSPEVVEMVGPVRAVGYEKPPVPFGSKLRTTLMIMRLFTKMMIWRIREGKSWKPFFDEHSLRPIKKPITLTDVEREALEAKVI